MAHAGDLSIHAISDLRKAGRPVEALRQLCEAAFRNRCSDLLASEFFGAPTTPLSGSGRTCLLLEAARHRAGTPAADNPGFAEWFNSKVRSTQWSQLFPDLFGSADGDNCWRVLAGLRRDLALLVHSPAADSGIEKSLVRIVEGYEAAFTLPSGGTWPASTSEPSWLASSIPEEFKNALRHCARTTSWASPAIHFVGQTLLYLLGNDLPAPSATATTRILGVDHSQQDGFVLHLVVEAIPNGTGVIIPHPLYAGYLATDESFQQALLRAINAIHDDLPEPRHDFRWTIWFPDNVGLPGSLPAVSGGSAGAALYCAMRAAATREPLDDQAVITAALTDSSALSQIGGLSEKLLATRDREHLRSARIRRILVSSNQPWDGHTLPATGHQIPVDDWKIQLHPVPDRQSAYRQLTEYSRIAKAIKAALAKRADDLLEGPEGLCRPYIAPTLSKRVQETDERGQPVFVQKILKRKYSTLMLRAKFKRHGARIRILADSGLGKSTLLVAAERAIAQLPDLRIPIRLGAGPRSTRTEKSGRAIPINRLCDIAWDQPLESVVEQIAKALHDIIPSALRKQIPAYLKEAIQRGDAVFLLDAIDQTRRDILLASFLAEAPDCPAIVTGRPETLDTKRESYRSVDWLDYKLEPLQQDRGDIETYCGADERDAGLAQQLLNNNEWQDLIFIPVLLKQLRDLHRGGKLTSLANREAVYSATLHMLLAQARRGAPDAGMDEIAKLTPQKIERQFAECAWDMLRSADAAGTKFTGQISGDDLETFQDKWGPFVDQLKTLNLTAHDTYFDPFGHEIAVVAWRHLSFGEWFAGLHLASLDEDRQREFFEKHARSPDRGWVIAFAMSAAQRLAEEGRLSTEVVERMARWLIEYGNPFHLRRTLDGQRLTISQELNGLCNWLVHRDWDFHRVEAVRPEVDQQAAEILDTMFALDDQHLPKYRDSRWLHAAWDLVRDTAGEQSGGSAAGDEVSGRTPTPSPPAPLPGGEGSKKIYNHMPQEICRAIHDRFLSEFETRLNQYAAIRSDKDRAAWRHHNRGLIQLVPEECREALGLPAPELEAIRTWPSVPQLPSSPLPPGEGPGVRASRNTPLSPTLYAQLRDEFNQRLQDHQVNWCLCPPKNWVHPHGRHPRLCQIGDGPERDPHFLEPGYYLQRAPVTNIQFEALDPHHKHSRRTDWKRDDEPEKTALDDHPVVEVTWFQARMLAVWMTGLNKRFGTFALPIEEDWETCCRAGRDADGEITGVPWIDPQGQEHFDVLTSQQANFDGNYPEPDRDDLKGPGYPYLEGTVPVGRYRANGFGLVDMQGQVWEWQETPWERSDSKAPPNENERTVSRVVRGGSWNYSAWSSRSSGRLRFSAEIRDLNLGFRLSRTRSN